MWASEALFISHQRCPLISLSLGQGLLPTKRRSRYLRRFFCFLLSTCKIVGCLRQLNFDCLTAPDGHLRSPSLLFLRKNEWRDSHSSFSQSCRKVDKRTTFDTFRHRSLFTCVITSCRVILPISGLFKSVYHKRTNNEANITLDNMYHCDTMWKYW